MSEWTTTPPTKPGWYWWKSDKYPRGYPREVIKRFTSGTLFVSLGSQNVTPKQIGGEWWTTPIKEPK